MRASGDYFVTVIEDTRKSEIIGAASLVLEHKFIHNCAVVYIACFIYEYIITDGAAENFKMKQKFSNCTMMIT